MDKNETQFLWCEAYRPHKIADCILPSDLKATFQAYVDMKNVPNLLLTGSAGTGKTTVAKAMCEEAGTDFMFINGSDERGIDVLRTKIKTYASSISFGGGRKAIIIDEADNLTGDAQAAMKAAIEEFSVNCAFIFTANHMNKLIPPIHSRCSVIEFKITGLTKAKMASQFFKRVEFILTKENVKYDINVVTEVVSKFFPDYRRTLNELQRYSVSGNIDVGILARFSDVSIKELVAFLKDKDFRGMKKWVSANSDLDAAKLYRKVYDSLYDVLEPESIPGAILSIAEYSYRNSFVSDPEINMVACFISIMAECRFK